MSNHFFQFKQFTVYQDKCAMKVSTDACIQGAWTPMPEGARHVLDIGTGTGLLSLMLLQRSGTIQVDAIEIDERAAEQATDNAQQSKWRDNINVICADVKTYEFQNRYDLIICNPPFFNNSLTGPNEQRNTARHTTSLSYGDLLGVISKYLNEGGLASILLPVPEFEHFKLLTGKYGLYLRQQLWIIPRVGKPANRVVAVLSKGKETIEDDEVNIRQADNEEYTEAFIELLRPYYLHL